MSTTGTTAQSQVDARTQRFERLLRLRGQGSTSSSNKTYIDQITIGLMTIEQLDGKLGVDDHSTLSSRFKEAGRLRDKREETKALKQLVKDVQSQLAKTREAHLQAVRAYAKAASDARKVGDGLREKAAAILTSDASLIAQVKELAMRVLDDVRVERLKIDEADDVAERGDLRNAKSSADQIKRRLENETQPRLAEAKQFWDDAKSALTDVPGLRDLIEALRSDNLTDVHIKATLDEAVGTLASKVAAKTLSVETATEEVVTHAQTFQTKREEGKVAFARLSKALSEALDTVQAHRRNVPAKAGELLNDYVAAKGALDGRDYAEADRLKGQLDKLITAIDEMIVERQEAWKQAKAVIRALDLRIELQSDWEGVTLPHPTAVLAKTCEDLKLTPDTHTLIAELIVDTERVERLRLAVRANDKAYTAWNNEDLAEARGVATTAVQKAADLTAKAIGDLETDLSKVGGIDAPFRTVQRFRGLHEIAWSEFQAHLGAVTQVDNLETDAFVLRFQTLAQEVAKAHDGDGMDLTLDEEKRVLWTKRWADIEGNVVHLITQFEVHGGTKGTPRDDLNEANQGFQNALDAKKWGDVELLTAAFLKQQRELMGQVLLLQQQTRLARNGAMAVLEEDRRLHPLAKQAVEDMPVPTVIGKGAAQKAKAKALTHLAFLATRLDIHQQTLESPNFCTTEVVALTQERLTNIQATLKEITKQAKAKDAKALTAAAENTQGGTEWVKARLKRLEDLQKKFPYFQTDGVKTLVEEYTEAKGRVDELTWAERTVLDGKYMQLVARFTKYMDADAEVRKKGSNAEVAHVEIKARLKDDKILSSLWKQYEAEYKAQEGEKDPQSRLPMLNELLPRQSKIRNAMQMDGTEQKVAFATLVAEADVAAEDELRKRKQYKRELERLKSEVSTPWYDRLINWVMSKESLDFGGPRNLLSTAEEFGKVGKYDEAMQNLRIAQNQLDTIVEAGVTGSEAVSLDQLVKLNQEWRAAVELFDKGVTDFVSWWDDIQGDLDDTQLREVKKATEGLKGLFSKTVFGDRIGLLRTAPDWDVRTRAAENGIAQVRQYKEQLLGEVRIELLTHCPIKSNPGFGAGSSLYRVLDRLERNFHMARPKYQG